MARGKRGRAEAEAAAAEPAGAGDIVERIGEHREGRRWAALALAEAAGWPLWRVRKKLGGVSAASMQRWRAALSTRNDVSDAPRRVAKSRKITESDLAKVRAAILEPLQRGGKRKRSLRRALPRAIGQGATNATYEAYRQRLRSSDDDPWAPQRPHAIEAHSSAQLDARRAHCSRHARTIGQICLFTDSSWFHGEHVRMGAGEAEWGPLGQPGTREKKSRAAYAFHAYGGVSARGATPLIEAAGTTPARGARGRGRGRGRGAARGAGARAATVTSQFYREDVLVRADGDGLLQQGVRIMGGRFLFQQDGARAHTCAPHTAAGAATRALIAQHANLLEPWPARSPDLSPIEKAWAHCKQHLWSAEHLHWHDITTFKAAVRQAWAEVITPAYCRRLFGGIRNTYDVCRRADGAAILGWGARARVP